MQPTLPPIASLPLLLLLQATLLGQDASWPHFAGPRHNNTTTESSWTATGTLRWEAQVGLGYSNVSVADGRAFTIGHDADSETDTVYCFDAASGEPTWTYNYPCDTLAKAHTGGSLTTPTIWREHVYILDREGKFRCFAADTGKVVFEKNLRKDADTEQPSWGYASSPLPLDGRLYIHVGRVLAMDEKGKIAWRSNDLGHAYSTPAPLKLAGRDCLAVFAGSGLSVIDRKTGKGLSSFPWETSYDVNAATPVVVEGNRLFISSGYGTGCAMVKAVGRELKELWRKP